MDYLNPALIGAAVGLVGALVVQVVTLWRDRLARKHDARQRHVKWLREHLIDSYSNCLFNLYQLIDLGEQTINNPAINVPVDARLVGECQRYLLLVAAQADSKTRENLNGFVDRIASAVDAEAKANWTRHGVGDVIRLMQNDGRARQRGLVAYDIPSPDSSLVVSIA